jgi:hypothetical protein
MYESSEQGCRNSSCPYIHQAQANAFPAEVIEALPLNQKAVRRLRHGAS